MILKQDLKGSNWVVPMGLEAAKQFLQAGTRVIISGRNQQKLDAVKACTRN